MANRYWVGGTGNWNDDNWSDSSGGATLGSVITYYFDGSDSVATATDGTWTTITNADDGSTSTEAYSTSTTSAMNIGGTNAPASGLTIIQVRFRVYGTSSSSLSTDNSIYTSGQGELLAADNPGHFTDTWTDYTTLSTPTGGWTWAKLQALEFYTESADINIAPYDAGVAKVEVEVTTAGVPTSSDDVFIDSSSGFGSGGTITVDVDAYVNDFTSTTGDTYSLDFNANYVDLYLYGDLVLESGLTADFVGVNLVSGANHSIDFSGATVNGNYGSWTHEDGSEVSLLSDFIIEDSYIYYYLLEGTFTTNNYNVALEYFEVDASTGSASTVNMGNSTFSVSYFIVYSYDGETPTINHGTSTIYFNNYGNAYFYDDDNDVYYSDGLYNLTANDNTQVDLGSGITFNGDFTLGVGCELNFDNEGGETTTFLGNISLSGENGNENTLSKNSTSSLYQEVAAGSGGVYSQDASWDTAHDATTGDSGGSAGYPYATAEHYGSDKLIGRVFLPVDTSGIPDDATITAAYLYIKPFSKNNDDSTGDYDYLNIYESTQASSSGLTTADFDAVGDTELSARKQIDNIYTSFTSSWALNTAGKAIINKTGATYFALRIGNDVDDVDLTTGDNTSNQVRVDIANCYFRVYYLTTDGASIAKSMPILTADYLNISYSSAVGSGWYAENGSTDSGNNSGWIFSEAPVTSFTHDASDVKATSVKLNASLLQTEGQTVTERGFCVSKNENPDINDLTFTSSDTTDYFSATATGLEPNTTYHCRAYCIYNPTIYGQDITFTTASYPDYKEKQFYYKVYDDDSYVTTWTGDVISEPKFTTEINGGPGQLVVRLAREFEGYGEEVDVKVNNQVDVYVSDGEEPNGELLYSGYISSYAPELTDGKELVAVTLLPYVTETSRYMLRDGDDTEIAYLSYDPSDIFRDVLSKFQADGGSLNSTSTSIQDTGTTVTYTFNTNTVKQAFDKIIELAPENWYWSVDPDGTVNFQEKPSTVTHDLSIGQHIVSMKPEKRVEGMTNRVYFTGGGDPPLYVVKERTSSIDAYGLYATKIVDQRVTTEATATTICERILDEKDEVEVRTKLVIADSNASVGNQGYDIESISVGDTIRIKNLDFGSKSNSVWDVDLWDVAVWDSTLSSIAGDPLLVVKTKYMPNYLEADVSTRFPSVSKRIEDINRNLQDSQTKDNPATPS